MDYRRGDHCVYHCEYHIVITTKYRRNVINAGVWAYLERKLLEINEHYPSIFFKTRNHDENHIHLQVIIPPTMSVGKVIGLIKTNTARRIKEQFPFLKKVYWGTDNLWSSSYFVSTAGVDAKVLAKYIELQGREDEGQTAKLFA